MTLRQLERLLAGDKVGIKNGKSIRNIEIHIRRDITKWKGWGGERKPTELLQKANRGNYR